MYILIDARGTETRVSGLTREQWEECARRGVIVLEEFSSACKLDDADSRINSKWLEL